MSVFCFDNNLSPRLVQILKILRHQGVIHVRAHHRTDPGDATMIDRAASEGWILVTADTRMRSHPATAAAFQQRRITALFVGGSILHKDLHEQAVWFVRHWEEVAAELPQAPQGSIFESRVNRTLARID